MGGQSHPDLSSAPPDRTWSIEVRISNNHTTTHERVLLRYGHGQYQNDGRYWDIWSNKVGPRVDNPAEALNRMHAVIQQVLYEILIASRIPPGT
jgi:hypothetical protein